MSEAETWRRCSACKEPIALGAQYWACNVSTCNRKRTALAFCSVSCWEVHLPVARHRESWAVEKRAPATAEPADTAPKASSAAAAPRPSGRSGTRRLVRPSGDAAAPAARASEGSADVPREVLIVASRLKDYVRARCGFNTSDRVLEPLSQIVREVCEEAIRNAERDGRRTVLDRDIPKRRG